MPSTHGKGDCAESAGLIALDVLDASFSPSPLAVEAFSAGPNLLRCSPDIRSSDLLSALSEARNIDKNRVVLGAGSSELIYRILPELFGKGPVLLTDPTYSEYPYLARILGIPTRTYKLQACQHWRIDLPAFIEAARECAAIVLVNPNNPTGSALTREELLELREEIAGHVPIWVDEAYVDYAQSPRTMETESRDGLYVLKSLSKAYALSGVRAAYLVAPETEARCLQDRTPPWIIGRAGQAASAAALRDGDYYRAQWCNARSRTKEFAQQLAKIGYQVSFGELPAVLIQVPNDHNSSTWAAVLKDHGIVVRTPEGMGEVLAGRFVRIALPSQEQTNRVLAILKTTC